MRLLLLLLLLAVPAWGYENAAVGLTVPDPAGWEVRTSSEKGALVRYYAPAGPGPRGSIGVSAEEIGEVTELTSEQVKAALRRLAADLDGFELLGSRPVRVGGARAWRLGYRAKAHQHVFRATQVMLVRSGRLYVLTLTTSEEGHAAAVPVFDKLLAGLVITG